MDTETSQKRDGGTNIDPRNLYEARIAILRCKDKQYERDHADQPGDERNQTQAGDKSRRDENRTHYAEEHRSMAQQQGHIRRDRLHLVEPAELLHGQYTRERRQIDDPRNNEQPRDQITHALIVPRVVVATITCEVVVHSFERKRSTLDGYAGRRRAAAADAMRKGRAVTTTTLKAAGGIGFALVFTVQVLNKPLLAFIAGRTAGISG